MTLTAIRGVWNNHLFCLNFLRPTPQISRRGKWSAAFVLIGLIIRFSNGKDYPYFLSKLEALQLLFIF
jgi:hypothetical protein